MSGTDKSPQILNAASNLVGFCLVIITSINALKLSAQTIIDEITAIATLLFMCSVLLSFLSIRNSSTRSRKYESVAEISFICGLLLILVTVWMITFDFID